jgi:aspartyl-tRNA(Asn)/glutamyl-tRNA(Gln) amidotransferase subunit B
MAWPGSLPVLNANPVIQALRVSLALECKNIHGISTFDRKQYFYHDLPAGYQVTQKHEPIASDGKLRLFPVFDRGIDLEVRIARLQLEQDTMRTTEYSPESSAVFMEMSRFVP